MNNESTTAIGTAFEKQVFSIIQSLVDNDDFYVNRKNSKVFFKKAYFSKKRDSNIIFDITIEAYLSGGEKYSQLTIIECKYLNQKVSVDDVEEFSAKISQVGEDNTKGIIITNLGFQLGALNFAIAQGIGIAKCIDNKNFEWISHRKTKEGRNTEMADVLVDENKLDFKFVALIDNAISDNFGDALLQLRIIDRYEFKEKFLKVPFRTVQQIEDIAVRLEKQNVYDKYRLDTDKLCTFLSGKYDIEFDFESQLDNGVLGKIQFSPLKISVTKSLKTDMNRWRFTLAHEVGHLFLHYNLLRDKMSEKSDTEFSLSFGYNISEPTSRILEYQANMLASQMLMPEESFLRIVFQYFVEENINKNMLYLDNQQVNRNLVFTLLRRISELFQVSQESAKIKMIAMGLLEDHSIDNSMYRILRSLYPGNKKYKRL